ncbi:MAG: NAD(P)H-dependent oxidoreductase subunit E [Chloroflexi bacterium]|nr:NAD(P)H-dependent oxidoreductase subunit E [Chloroflexota bacterium]
MNSTAGDISAEAKKRGKLLVLLEQAQDKLGCLPKEFMARLAASLGLSISEVYGLATFYSFLSPGPSGRNVIRVCKSLPCYLKDLLIESVKREIGVGPGETTSDGRFSFELTNCIGACDQAPAMMVNHDVYGGLTPEELPRILERYK